MGVFSRLEEISTAADKETEAAVDKLLIYLTQPKENECRLITDGYCPVFDREDADCYGNKGCVMKKAGLYYCSEINEIVDKEACRECNDDFDCGCCPDMLTDTPPFNCKECGKIKIEFEAGTYCFDKNKDPQKVAEMIKDIIENRGPYFSC